MGASIKKDVPTYSEGYFCGTVTSLSHTGLFWKSWEIELLCDGLRDQRNLSSDGKTVTKSQVANIRQFSIDAQSCRGENISALVAQLQRQLDQGVKTKISYVRPLIVFPCQGWTEYLIQKVETE